MQYYSTSREKEVLTHAAAVDELLRMVLRTEASHRQKKKKTLSDSSSMKHSRVPVIYRDRKQNGSKGRSGRER